MLTTWKELIAGQYGAALATLNAVVDLCPESDWQTPLVELAFCQVAFHTLFFTDYYLGHDASTFRTQAFHREHAGVFRDYEELEPRRQVHMYERPWIRIYSEHCRRKALAVVADETEDDLAAKAAFDRRDFTRAELHVYNIRHIQHHAAALGLRLRTAHGLALPWVGSVPRA